MICFRSKAGADIWMLGSHAELVLTALGREPAPAGIFESADIGKALAVFAAHPAAAPAEVLDEDGDPDVPDLARRAWPLLQLLRQAQSQDQHVTWSSS